MSSKLSTAATPVARKISISGGLAVVMIVLAALALLGAGWFVMLAHSALPELDGSLAVRGITGPVSVTRDGHGLPTIEAATFDDLFFAQGYVTAQDRLFQMELMRRSARGELAELVGEVALPHDRQQRILGIRDAAERGLATANAEERQHLSPYTRGVNAFIDSHRGRLPLEFRILWLHYGHEVTLAAITHQLVLSNRSGAKAFIVSARRKLKLYLHNRGLTPAALKAGLMAHGSKVREVRQYRAFAA